MKQLKSFMNSALVSVLFFFSLSAQESIQIGGHLYEGLRTYVAYTQPDNGEYAFACFLNGKIEPLAKKEITNNFVTNSPNPLYNGNIQYIMPFQRFPYVVLRNSANVYCILNLATATLPMKIIGTENINDSQGQVSSGIIGIVSFLGVSQKKLTSYMIAAVKPHEGNWGEPGSGFALVKTLMPDQEKDEKEKKEKEERKVEHIELSVLNAQTGQRDGNKALDVQNFPASINDGLGAVFPGDAINMWWEPTLNRIFIPLHVKTKENATAQQGVCGLLVGYVENDQLKIYPAISPDSFAQDQDSIVAAMGANKEISLRKVHVMHTSTELPYLIVWGGVGSWDETNHKIYALPLTNMYEKVPNRFLRSTHAHGTIASQNGSVCVSYIGGAMGRFRGRQFTRAIETPDDHMEANNPKTLVGAQGTIIGTITDMIALKDSVCISVEHNNVYSVYRSYALFDADGTIVSWTPWRRSTTNVKRIHSLSLSNSKELLVLGQNEKGEWVQEPAHWYMANDQTSVYQSIAEMVKREFGSGGILGMQYYNHQLPGLCGTTSCAMLSVLGKGKVLLAPMAFGDGEIKPCNVSQIEQNIALFKGSTLDAVGHITCSSIVHDDAQAWFVVGGINGVAVCSKQGDGWPLAEGIAHSLPTLSTEFAFTKFGDFKFVRSLIFVDSYLFVLTKDALYRISIRGKPNQWSAVKLLDRKMLNASLTQIFIHGPLAILGTTAGLFRSANHCDVRSASTQQEITWQPLEMARTVPWSVLQFFSLSSASQTNTDFDNRQLFVLSVSSTLQESYVFRLFVRDTKDGVTDETVQVVKDYCCPDKEGPYITFPAKRTRFATNGLVHLSVTDGSNPVIHVWPTFTGGKQVPSEKGYVPNFVWPQQVERAINCLVCNESTGEWFAGGSLGLAVYQT